MIQAISTDLACELFNPFAPKLRDSGSRPSADALTAFRDAWCNSTMSLFRCVLFWAATCALVSGGELQDAAARGDLEKVKSLARANPGEVSARVSGTTALHEAVRAGHLEVVKWLVDNGADVNATDFSKLTPLRLARSPEVASYLRGKGALEKVAPVVAMTAPVKPAVPPKPLFNQTNSPVASSVPVRSSTAPNQEVASTPTKPPASAPTNQPPSQADMMALFYPIHEAARVGDVEQIKFLFKQSPDLVDATDEKGRTPLHIAAANFRTNAAQVLLSLRAKVNARTDSGQTPLHTAVRQGDIAMVRLLLANRASVNARDKFDNTPLLLAVQSANSDSTDQPTGGTQRSGVTNWVQQIAMVNTLLTNAAEPAQVNVRNRAGLTPLGEAIRMGNRGAVEAFLRAGAEPNAIEGPGAVTPLHLAAGRGHAPIVQTLLKYRANVNQPDARGETPLVYALRGGRTNVIAAIQSAGGNIGAPLTLSPSQKSLVDFYEVTESKLRRASGAEKGRLLIALNPTKAELQRMFPKHHVAALRVVEQVNQQIKTAFAQPLRDADENKQIWRIRPEEPSVLAQEWRSRGTLASDLPMFSLAVEKTGDTSRPGDFCLVNGRWVLLPPLHLIAAAHNTAASAK
jgi:ankyrin repeat protein